MQRREIVCGKTEERKGLKQDAREESGESVLENPSSLCGIGGAGEEW